jgi:hypothetical protein
MAARTFTFNVVSNTSPIDAAMASVTPGINGVVEFSCPSLNTVDPITGSTVWGSAGGPDLLAWGNMMDYDPTTGRYFIAGGRPATDAPPQSMIYYDKYLNQWAAFRNWSGTGSGHLYRNTTVAPAHRRVLHWARSGSGVPMWDIDTNTYAGTIPKCPTNIGGYNNSWNGQTVIVWHPNLGAQGSVIYADPSQDRVARFDWATQAWVGITSPPQLGLWDNLHFCGHYHPLVDKVIIGVSVYSTDETALAIVDSAGGISYSAPAPLTLSSDGDPHGTFIPHPTRAASIGICNSSKKIWSYEWATNTWVFRADIPTTSPLYASQNVVAFVTDSGICFTKAGPPERMYLYKPDF